MDYMIEVIDESLAEVGMYGGTRWAISVKADWSVMTTLSLWSPVRV